MNQPQSRVGFWYLVGAYTVWGCSPFIWHAMEQLTPFEIILHRIIWSMPILLIALMTAKQLHKLVLLSTKDYLLLGCTSLLVSANWLIFVWAVGNARLVEASLGYFILPLFNVFLGILFFKEKLHSMQYLSLVVASIGAGLLMVENSYFPWVALSLVVSFGFYSLLRKNMKVGSLVGLSVENIILLPFALICLLALWQTDANNFDFFSKTRDLLVPMAGVFTAIPLLWAISGMKKISFATSGFLFYWNPTLQFLIGVWVFDEPMNQTMLISFIFIWAATVIYFLFNKKPTYSN